MRTLLTAG